MNVSDLKEGESAHVTCVCAGKNIEGRLALLNVYAGAHVTLVRRAPFGGSLMLEAGGVRLAVHKGIAARIECEREETE